MFTHSFVIIHARTHNDTCFVGDIFNRRIPVVVLNCLTTVFVQSIV